MWGDKICWFWCFKKTRVSVRKVFGNFLEFELSRVFVIYKEGVKFLSKILSHSAEKYRRGTLTCIKICGFRNFSVEQRGASILVREMSHSTEKLYKLTLLLSPCKIWAALKPFKFFRKFVQCALKLDRFEAKKRILRKRNNEKSLNYRVFFLPKRAN